MQTRARVALIATMAAALTLSLAACQPSTTTSPHPAPPAASSTPNPTTPPAPSGSQPATRTTATCADLSSPAQLDPLFTAAVAVPAANRTSAAIGSEIDNSYAVEEAGGISCTWMSANSIVTSEGRTEYQGAIVSILPATTDDFAAFAAANPSGSGHVTVCYVGYCQFDQLEPNGWWLSINVDGMPGADEGDAASLSAPVFTAISSTVAALPAPTTPWSIPAPAVTLPATCLALISGSQLASALGIGTAATVRPNDYPSQYTTAFDVTGGSICSWQEADGFTDLAEIQVLPGGAWAQAAAVATTESLGLTLPKPAIAGVPAGSTALFDHVDSTSLDIVVGGNWIKLVRGHGPAIGGLDDAGVLKAVAAKIAALHPAS